MLNSNLPLYIFSLLLIISAHPCSCSDISDDCGSSFVCANIANITYPFRRDIQPHTCGYPGLDLNCDNGVASIKLNDVKYLVLNIDFGKNTLHVARDGNINGICSLLQLNSTTINTTLFEYVHGYSNITLHYNCPPSFMPFPEREKARRQFNCSVNGYVNTKGYIQTGPDDSDGCRDSVVLVVPVEFFSEGDGNSTMGSRLEEVVRKGFEVKWNVDVTACNECSESEGKCGYDLYKKKPTCVSSHASQDQPEMSSKGDSGMSSKVDLRLVVTIGFSAGMTGMIVMGVGIICAMRWSTLLGKAMLLWQKETNQNGHDNVERLIRKYEYLSPKRFTYAYIKKITNSFSDKLGEGGCGSVYKGTLQDDRLVAVKILKNSKNDGEGFVNEVASISRTSHVNVVALLGFCCERDKRALVFEFMPNGSLDGFIYNNGSHNRLKSESLFQIACGIARGLEYLHRGCSTRILHFDIKPHNILLDKDLVPKISDFGLAKQCAGEESVVLMMGARGTPGYIAPELFCRNFGGVSHKSDVYSYGMMVLEKVGGRKNIDVGVSKTSEVFFPSFMHEKIESGEILKLGSEEECVIARKMVVVSLWCIQTMPANRPSMSKVLDMLEASVESLPIPPKPILTSPPRSPTHSSTIATQQSSTMSSQ